MSLSGAKRGFPTLNPASSLTALWPERARQGRVERFDLRDAAALIAGQVQQVERPETS